MAVPLLFFSLLILLIFKEFKIQRWKINGVFIITHYFANHSIHIQNNNVE